MNGVLEVLLYIILAEVLLLIVFFALLLLDVHRVTLFEQKVEQMLPPQSIQEADLALWELEQ